MLFLRRYGVPRRQKPKVSKMIYKNSVLLISLAVLAISSCATSTSTAHKIPITLENSDQLVGLWQGRWAGSGYDGAMEIYITEVTETGKVLGSRMYTSSSLDTVGQIRDGQLELDVEKGDKDQIILDLYEEEEGNRYMAGTYRTHSGDENYKGKVMDLTKTE